MLALVDAKRDEYFDELETVDARDLMDPDVTKWSRISDKVMARGHSPCVRDHAMCKSKWHLLIPDYRRIADYHARTGTNTELYWSQTTREHVEEGLPKSFSPEVYCRIHEWFGRRPQIQPPHVRDLLHPGDSNYIVEKDASDDDVEVVEENLSHEGKDGVDVGNSSTLVSATPLGTATSGKARSPAFGNASAAAEHHPRIQPNAGEHRVPWTVSPVVLSSSESGGSNARRYPGSTGVRRRTSSAHAALAEATKATGDVMVAQMQQMVGATRETESNRLEVQLKLFSEKMQYQREKDQRLYEQGLLASQNARLAIAKQGELVQCLSEISKVLSVGLMVSGDPVVHCGQAAVASPASQRPSAQVINTTEAPAMSMAPGEEVGEEDGPRTAAVPFPPADLMKR
jgi:hypothetical protein